MNNTKSANHPRANAFKEILVLLGGFVVLSTFFVNEVKRDRLKDLSTSIETARTTYLLRSSLEAQTEHIENIRDHLVNGPLPLPATASGWKHRLEILALRYEYPDYLRDKAALESIGDLKEKLPNLDEDDKKEASLREILMREGRLANDRRAISYRLGEPGPEERKRNDATIKGDEDALEDLQKDLEESTFGEAISDYGEKVVMRAREIQKQDEKHAEFWRDLGAYVLFPVGFIIALAGQMVGVKFGEG